MGVLRLPQPLGRGSTAVPPPFLVWSTQPLESSMRCREESIFLTHLTGFYPNVTANRARAAEFRSGARRAREPAPLPRACRCPPGRCLLASVARIVIVVRCRVWRTVDPGAEWPTVKERAAPRGEDGCILWFLSRRGRNPCDVRARAGPRAQPQPLLGVGHTQTRAPGGTPTRHR
jgi:hypothetical protein